MPELPSSKLSYHRLSRVTIVTHFELPSSCEISEIELPSSLWESFSNDYTQMQQVTCKITISTNSVYINVGSYHKLTVEFFPYPSQLNMTDLTCGFVYITN